MFADQYTPVGKPASWFCPRHEIAYWGRLVEAGEIFYLWRNGRNEGLMETVEQSIRYTPKQHGGIRHCDGCGKYFVDGKFHNVFQGKLTYLEVHNRSGCDRGLSDHIYWDMELEDGDARFVDENAINVREFMGIL